jgi:hypothetical protein
MEIVEGAIASHPAPTIAFFVHPQVSAWGTVNDDSAIRTEVSGVSTRIEVPVIDFAACLERWHPALPEDRH